MRTTTTRTARPWGRGLLKASVAGLALALALTPAIAASPAWAANGTITINVPTGTQTDTQLTYKLYKVFDAYSSDAGVSYRLVTTAITGDDGNGGTETKVSAKSAVPNVAAVVGGNYDATTDPHFILDAAGNVHYGTEFTTEAAATTAKGESADIVTTAVTTVAATSSTPATVVYVNSAALTADAIAAIEEYVATDKPIQTITGTTSTGTVSFNDVDDGYYYITTATGTAVTIDTNTPNATVEDKNTVPTIDKTILSVKTGDDNTGSIDTQGTNGEANATDGDKSDNAIAQVGSTVSYQVEILVGNGTKLIAFHDNMEPGLTLDKSSVTVQFYTGSAGSYAVASTENASSYYTVRADQDAEQENPTTADNPDSGDTFTVDFNDDLFTLSSGGQSVSRIVVSYSATVNSDALTSDPLTNTTHVTYGDNHQSTTEDSTNVYNATIKVVKHNGSNTALAGAGFVLKNADGKFYKATTETTTTTDLNGTSTTTTVATDVEWVDSQDAATELMSGDDGNLYGVTTTTDTSGNTIKSANTAAGQRAFTGLPDGTYTLVESTTPRGYNTAADETITINGAGTTDALKTANLSQSTTIVNRTGAELPSTGGIGTTVLYAVGGVLVVGAGVALVTKRKMDRDR